MLLSDRYIRLALKSGDIGIEPFDESRLEATSVDLTLGNEFKRFRGETRSIDTHEPVPAMEVVYVNDGEHFVIKPNEFVLGTTREHIKLRAHQGRLDGKSSLGRIGLMIHATAGFIDPGFEGNLTLELVNVSGLYISIYPGDPIAQISFMLVHGKIDRPYGHEDRNSKYQGQKGVTESQYHRNF